MNYYQEIKNPTRNNRSHYRNAALRNKYIIAANKNKKKKIIKYHIILLIHK